MVMEWIFGLVLGVLSLLGIGKLLELSFKARQERKEAKKDLDTTNAAKLIDADVHAFEAISTRLTIVEGKLDKVNDELTEERVKNANIEAEQKVENAKLEAENLRLTKDNNRLEKEVDRQRERIHELANNINGKDLLINEMKAALKRSDETIAVLRSELNETTKEVNALSRKLKGL